MQIFKLKFEVDAYQSLLTRNTRVHQQRLMSMRGESKADLWPDPLEVVVDNQKAPEPDIYCCEATSMVISGRSEQVLRPVFEPIAEFLPVAWRDRQGVLVNVLGTHDCLDEDRMQWHVQGVVVKEFAFIKTKVPRHIPFRLREIPNGLYCADHGDGEEIFPALVERHSLTGLRFEQVWAE